MAGGGNGCVFCGGLGTVHTETAYLRTSRSWRLRFLGRLLQGARCELSLVCPVCDADPGTAPDAWKRNLDAYFKASPDVGLEVAKASWSELNNWMSKGGWNPWTT